MNLTPEQLAKAKAAKSEEELLALAKENGIGFTEEEAAKYFADLHKEGKLADEELDNVAGGSDCEDGRTYSEDSPYYLITTMFNCCSHYKCGSPDKYCLKTCGDCAYSYRYDFTLYCTARTRNNDPYK